MKIFIKIILGLFVFIGAAAYFAPASIIEKFLPDNISTVGINGTLWNGKVQNVVIDKIGLQNTKWSANPLNLLLGKIKADVNIDSSNLKGDFATTYSNNDILAEDILLNGELSILAPYFERYGLTINGQFNADFDLLHIKDNLPYKINGTLLTSNTNILGIIPMNLGNVNSQFTEQSDGMLISLNNQNGELDINGTINLTNNGAYSADITLSKNAITPDNVLQTMQLIGEKISEDSVKVQQRGRLNI